MSSCAFLFQTFSSFFWLKFISAQSHNSFTIKEYRATNFYLKWFSYKYAQKITMQMSRLFIYPVQVDCFIKTVEVFFWSNNRLPHIFLFFSWYKNHDQTSLKKKKAIKLMKRLLQKRKPLHDQTNWGQKNLLKTIITY